MGMQVRIVLYAPSEKVAVEAARAAFAEIARLELVFSNYRRDSELSRLVLGVGTPQPVSEELFEVLAHAAVLSARSDGAFDVGAGALTSLWKTAIRRQRLPGADELRRARASSSGAAFVLDRESRTVQLGAATRLDLGAVAKGYILDRAVTMLGDSGIDRAMVEAGGDIVAAAPPPFGDGWSVRVPHVVGCVVSLRDAAISTSGDTEQFVEVDGRRYSHTVDPRTGLGITDRRLATVVAGDGMTADALATALTLVDADRRAALLAAYPGARALVVRTEPAGPAVERLDEASARPTTEPGCPELAHR